MRRGRGKGKKPNVVSSQEEKLPAFRRKGRPQKLLSDNIVEEQEEVEAENKENDVVDDMSPIDGRKRKASGQAEEDKDLTKHENDIGVKTGNDECVGFRQIGSRRKNKPRRAAEVGVDFGISVCP